MILFISDGRLGNQLFQYAFLNTLAQPNEKILCMNMGLFKKYFLIRNKRFINISNNRYIHFFARKVVQKFLMFLAHIKLIGLVTENIPQISYHKKKGLLPVTYVKTGFFQSEKQFSNKAIDFTIKDIYQNRAEDIMNALPNQTKVFIHVRRTDYLDVIYDGQKGIDLPMNYYNKTISYFKNKLKNPFFIFLTDDYEYVKGNFSYLESMYISKENMATDLALMSLCRYGVISNSSFSWWGAYFSKDKIEMIFPKYWYGWKNKKESHLGIQSEWATIVDPNEV